MRPQESTLLTSGGQIYILTSGDSLVLGQGGMGGSENTTTMCYRNGRLLTQTRDGQQRGSGLAWATSEIIGKPVVAWKAIFAELGAV